MLFRVGVVLGAVLLVLGGWLLADGLAEGIGTEVVADYLRLARTCATALPGAEIGRLTGLETDLTRPHWGRVRDELLGPLGAKACRAMDQYQAVIMHPGDCLVLYTDGIPEALNWESNVYGYDAWSAFLGRVLPKLPENASLVELLAGVQAHTCGRPPEDDVTLMVLRRRRQPATLV